MKAPLYGAGVTAMKKEFNKIALIDADRFKYLVTNDVWKLYQEEGTPTFSYGENYVQELVDRRLNGLHNLFGAAGMIFVFSGPRKKTFRYSLAFDKEYKGNRKEAVDRDYEGKYDDMAKVITCIKKTNPIVLFTEFEADDILSALQNEHTFIYSNDKDMVQVPGYHFHEDRMDIYHIDPARAMNNLCYQLLCGDSTDNISGIPGIGPKKSVDILDDVNPKRMIDTVFQQYKNKYGLYEGTDRFVETWNLIKLRLDRGDYFKSKIASAYQLRDNMINTLINGENKRA